MFGEIVVLIYSTIALLIKASLEAIYFHDFQAMKKTLRLWAAITISNLLSLGFSLLFNHFG